MVLGFEAREATKDIDVVICAPAAARVRQLATALAEELGWPADWLNDAAKGFVGQPSPGQILLEAPGIIARGVAATHQLALKLRPGATTSTSVTRGSSCATVHLKIP